MSFIGLVVTTNLSYALDAPWMAESKWLITLISCLLVGVLVAASLRGLALGKWVHNAGGVMLLATFATLIALPPADWQRGGEHPARGRLTIDMLVAHMAWHDDNHLEQLTRALEGRP